MIRSRMGIGYPPVVAGGTGGLSTSADERGFLAPVDRPPVLHACFIETVPKSAILVKRLRGVRMRFGVLPEQFVDGRLGFVRTRTHPEETSSLTDSYGPT